MKSYSQAGQDEFVSLMLPEPGTFLEVGSSHPDHLSNSHGLELLGWRGVCVDKGEWDYSSRKATVVVGDATKVDYLPLLKTLGWSVVDYLSVDTDDASLESLLRVLESGFRFKIITIEHDSYQRGPSLRDFERVVLLSHGYKLVCRDVCHPEIQNRPFEDWWLNPAFFTPDQIEKARHDNCCYTKILEDLKA